MKNALFVCLAVAPWALLFFTLKSDADVNADAVRTRGIRACSAYCSPSTGAWFHTDEPPGAYVCACGAIWMSSSAIDNGAEKNKP